MIKEILKGICLVTTLIVGATVVALLGVLWLFYIMFLLMDWMLK